MSYLNQKLFETMPQEINFDIAFEPTRMREHKYVVNTVTDEPIGIVGKSFNAVDHATFYQNVVNTMTDHLSVDAQRTAEIRWRHARNGAWTMMDMRLPDVSRTISTSKHDTNLEQRIIALHGVDGSCSNTTLFGAIDMFCTNGMIIGKYDKIRKKNTSNFSISMFVRELNRAKHDFYAEGDKLQEWALTSIAHVNVHELLKGIMKSDRKADKMYALYRTEVSTRGENVFALYSAFTNYSSYADERNGFSLKETGGDTQAISMLRREHEVASWVDSGAFKSLVAA